MMDLSRRRLTLAGMAMCLATPLSTFAQQTGSFPTGPIKVLVPFAAGGVVDVTARWISLQMGEVLGRPIYVENRPGASGALAAAALKQSAADGHTILIATNGLEVMNPFLFKKQAYQTSDLQRISILSDSSIALVVPKKIGVQNFEELAAYLKSKDGEATYGSWGQGSSGHIFGSILEQKLGINMIHVPYTGEVAALSDLARGDLVMSWASPNGARTAHANGDAVIIGVSGSARSPSLPEVPTFAEQGFDALKLGLYTVAYAPKGTPEPLVQALQEALKTVLEQPETKERFASFGHIPVGSTPAEFDAMIERESPIWQAAIEASGASVN